MLVRLGPSLRDNLALIQVNCRTTEPIVVIVKSRTTQEVLRVTLPLDLEFPLKFKKLPLEAWVWKDDTALALAELKGLEHSHVVLLHQVSHHAGCASRDARITIEVNKD